MFYKCKEYDNLKQGIGEDNNLDNYLSSEHLINKLNFNCKYYGEEELNSVIVEKAGISIIHFSARSLQKSLLKLSAVSIILV